MPLPPGPRAPVLVQTWEWLRRPTELLRRCAERHGSTFTLSVVGLGTMVVVWAPADVRRLFAAGPDELCQPRNARFLAALGPSSLLLLNGEEHLRHRRLLVPALRVRSGQPGLHELTRLHERILSTWPLGSPLPLLPRLQDLTRRSIVQRIFGDSAEDAALADAVCALCARASAVMSDPLTVLPLSVQRLLGRRSPWAQALEVLRQGNLHLYRAIARRRRVRDLAARQDVLSQLMLARDEDGRRLSDAELRDELFTLLIAGVDTTAIVLCWTLHELLGQPALFAQLQAQVRSVQRDAVLDVEALERLPLLDAALRETLRLWPVFPILARQLLRPMQLSAGELPAGTRVALCPYLSHRNPQVFPNPDQFLPERFLGPNSRKIPAASYFPFGGGLRRCVGAELGLHEMKLILGTLLARLSLERADPSPLRPAWRFFSLAPSSGLPVVLTEAAGRSAGPGHAGHAGHEVPTDELHLKAVACAG